MNDEAKNEILAKVDDVIAPGEMTLESAIEWTEDLISDLQTRVDAMKADRDR